MERIIISYNEYQKLLEAVEKNEVKAIIRLNFSKKTSEINLENRRAKFPDGQELKLEKINADEETCFIIENNSIRKAIIFSERTKKSYKLVATGNAPTVKISGIPMHRIKDISPIEDTREKIKAISPIKGKVLDTCTGLGYTAIASSKFAEEVISIDIDENMREMAHLNPYSKELFEKENIKLILADSFEEIKKFPKEYFDRIIHDPPTFALAGNLYSLAFYKELYRVLKPNGKLFHYTGDPGNKFKGRDIAGEILGRLHKAGFHTAYRIKDAAGVLAIK